MEATVIIGPVLLLLMVCLIARENSETGYVPIFFGPFFISVGNAALAYWLGPKFGGLVLVPMYLFAAYVLIRHCYFTLKQASFVIAIYLAADAAFGALRTVLFSK